VILVARSLDRTFDHVSKGEEPELPVLMSRARMPRPQAARPVASIRSMTNVFQMRDFVLGVEMPVPFSCTWLEWIHTPPLSSTVKKMVVRVVVKVRAEMLDA
jgi:hypothetical protein